MGGIRSIARCGPRTVSPAPAIAIHRGAAGRFRQTLVTGPYASQRLLAAGIRPKRHELVNELAIGRAQMFWMCVYQ